MYSLKSLRTLVEVNSIRFEDSKIQNKNEQINLRECFLKKSEIILKSKCPRSNFIQCFSQDQQFFESTIQVVKGMIHMQLKIKQRNNYQGSTNSFLETYENYSTSDELKNREEFFTVISFALNATLFVFSQQDNQLLVNSYGGNILGMSRRIQLANFDIPQPSMKSYYPIIQNHESEIFSKISFLLNPSIKSIYLNQQELGKLDSNTENNNCLPDSPLQFNSQTNTQWNKIQEQIIGNKFNYEKGVPSAKFLYKIDASSEQSRSINKKSTQEVEQRDKNQSSQTDVMVNQTKILIKEKINDQDVIFNQDKNQIHLLPDENQQQLSAQAQGLLQSSEQRRLKTNESIEAKKSTEYNFNSRLLHKRMQELLQLCSGNTGRISNLLNQGEKSTQNDTQIGEEYEGQYTAENIAHHVPQIQNRTSIGNGSLVSNVAKKNHLTNQKAQQKHQVAEFSNQISPADYSPLIYKPNKHGNISINAEVKAKQSYPTQQYLKYTTPHIQTQRILPSQKQQIQFNQPTNIYQQQRPKVQTVQHIGTNYYSPSYTNIIVSPTKQQPEYFTTQKKINPVYQRSHDSYPQFYQEKSNNQLFQVDLGKLYKYHHNY